MWDLRKILSQLNNGWRQWRLLGVMLTASGLLLLSGCVQYDLAVNFDSQTHGEIIQHIQIGDRLTTLSNDTARLWLASIKRRTRQLQGKTKQVSEQEIVVTIPFNNGSELAEKMNRFMNPVQENSSKSRKDVDLGLPEISSQMSVTQNNWLLVLRNRLIYDLDLRSLGVIAADGNLLISPDALLDLKFALRTPWGAKAIGDGLQTMSESETELDSNAAIDPEIRDRGRTLVWTLQPGQANHIEVIFWVPSPIGIGTVSIALFIGLSMYLKNLLSPPDRTPTQSIANDSSLNPNATETDATVASS